MNKLKKFGISASLNRGFSETISVVENHTSKFHNTIVPISRLEFDPDNPRNLTLGIEDLNKPLDQNDPDFVKKQRDLAGLVELAQTIKQSGLINPVSVYKLGDKYRLIAGERRTLASILSGVTEIEARVFSDKPRALELKLVQWAENNAREDLTLGERLVNIRDILDLFVKSEANKKVTAPVLSELTGLQLAQAANYLSVLKAPKELMHAITAGQINSLDKAVVISSIENKDHRIVAIELAIQGASLKQLRNFAKQENEVLKEKQVRIAKKTPLRLGVTNNVQVIKILVDAILKEPQYKKLSKQLPTTNWDSAAQAIDVFKKLIQLLEKDA